MTIDPIELNIVCYIIGIVLGTSLGYWIAFNAKKDKV